MEENIKNKEPLNKDFKVPKLRFKEFTGDWITCLISERYELVMGQSPNSVFYNTDKIGLPLIQGNNDIINGYTNSIRYTSQATKIAEKNDIILTVRAPVGCVGIVSKKCCIGRGVCALKGDNYLYYFLLAKGDYWKKISQGSTFDSINRNDIDQLKYFEPNSLEERKRIVLLFKKVDQKTLILENKISALKKYKEGLVLNILKPTISNWRNGSIHGFKLNHFLVPYKKLSTTDGYIHATLSKEGVSAKTERYDRDFLVKDGDKKYRITAYGDLIYNPANLKFGVICVNHFGTCVVSPIYETFKIKNIDKYLLEAIVTSKSFIRYALKFEEGTVYERRAVSSDDLLNIKICVDNIDLANMSSALQIIQRKLEELNSAIEQCDKLKRYLLNYMFI